MSAASAPLVLRGATLVAGDGSAPLSNAVVVVGRGRIVQVGPAGQTTIPDGARVVDVAGRFLTPGIINTHGHVGDDREPKLAQYASYGVTTTTSMGFDTEDIQGFKARQQAGELSGARIFSVMYRFMSSPMHPGSEYPTIPAALAKVDEIVAHGADFVKVWIDPQRGRHARLRRDYVSAIFARGREHGRRAMAHVFDLEDARMAVEEGVHVLAHNVRDQEIPDDFLAELRERDVTVVSTLAREEAMFVYGEEPAFLDDPWFRRGLSAEQLATVRTTKRDEQAADPEAGFYRRSMEIDMINLMRLWEAGVRVALGTDSGGAPERFFIMGWAEHRQMELMVQAGLRPGDVIRAFSRNAAEALDRPELGVVRPGAVADLLVLREDPLVDIRNMRTIETVYLGGAEFESTL